MIKTLKLSFSLKNTYRVNAILYAIKQIPLIKKLLPETLYSIKELKFFAYVLAAIWEVIATFAGKFLYFITLITGIGILYNKAPVDATFLHIFLILTIIGGYTNTSLFNLTKEKFYGVILMRMDAGEYTKVNYSYAILKVIIGFMPFTILFGRMYEIPLWLCLLLPLSVAGVKMSIAAFSLWYYEEKGSAYNENKLSKWMWASIGLLMMIAYGLPVIGIVLPDIVSTVLCILFIPVGAVGAIKIWCFQSYREIYQQLVAHFRNQMDNAKVVSKRQTQKVISSDCSITSNRKGFEYLNELFIKRHKRILWSASARIAVICFFLVVGVMIAFSQIPETKETVNKLLMTYLPYSVFIMYIINRGTGFTMALFMNCDQSLLTYSFFKQPKMILRLFTIRLREIIKINLLPATVIGVGLAWLLYASGGTDNPLNYAVIVISILSISIFFSVHYLTIYYLLQPYNVATEIKSGTYKLVSGGTYFICYFMMQVKLPTLLFGTACIIFCVLYCILACILAYRLAPKTFRIRA